MDQRAGRSTRLLHIAGLVAILSIGPIAPTLSAASPPSDELLQMIADLIGDPDKQMRAIGLQQVRSEAPGEAATKRFVGLLPTLSPIARADLVEALGERGDPAARGAIVALAGGTEPAVRVAALRALAGVGNESDVATLVHSLAADSPAEQDAGGQTLIRLVGAGVNRAMWEASTASPPAARVRVLEILTARAAKEMLPAIVTAASAGDASVRAAALDALRAMADAAQASDLIRLLRTAQSDAERSRAEAALLALCGRAPREKCVPPLVAGLADADVRTRQSLVQALARAGGVAALDAIMARQDDPDQTVRDEAIRMVSLWPDRSAAPRLVALAASDNLRHHVLAIRGLVRLAGPEGERPADLPGLSEAIRLARRSDEKRLALAVLGRVASLEALALTVTLLEDPALVEDAGRTVVAIAPSVGAKNPTAAIAALRRVLERTTGQNVRDQAQEALNAVQRQK